MNEMNQKPPERRCMFCDKKASEVSKLVAREDADGKPAICDECIGLAIDQIFADFPRANSELRDLNAEVELMRVVLMCDHEKDNDTRRIYPIEQRVARLISENEQLAKQFVDTKAAADSQQMKADRLIDRLNEARDLFLDCDLALKMTGKPEPLISRIREFIGRLEDPDMKKSSDG